MAFWILLLCAPSTGSFLGVLVTRLPYRRDVILEESRCDACHTPLRFWEMVPILGWFFLWGKCARCGAALSALYPFIETSAVLVVLVARSAFSGLPLVFACLTGWIFIVISFIAFRAERPFPGYRAPLAIAAGLGWALWLGGLYANFSR